MKLTGLKRTLLAGLVTLSVVGAPVATFTAGPAGRAPAAAPPAGGAVVHAPLHRVGGAGLCRPPLRLQHLLRLAHAQRHGVPSELAALSRKSARSEPRSTTGSTKPEV